ncbi:MAG TPA: glutathione S-transferase family protein [Rhizomicrobium sp.]|nr:glutathione S-transferase family protein [Rhizomicrobium sp.]
MTDVPKITLYGGSAGRSSRSLIALEELGLSYRHVPLKPWDSLADKEAVLRVNQNGRVPVLEDGGLVIWESMAINLYLADRYGKPPLWPGDPRERAFVYQWSIWGQTEIDVMARHRDRFSGVPERVERARNELHARLAILDDALEGRAYLVGEAFTLADLNLASTFVEPWEMKKPDGGDIRPGDERFPAVGAWLTRCTARPSFARVGALP